MKYYFVAWKEEAENSHLIDLPTYQVIGEYKNYVFLSRKEAEDYVTRVEIDEEDDEKREDLVIIECETDDEDSE